MRDIRGDLQERANLLGQQINAARGQFEQLIEQLKRERDSRRDDLKSELETVNKVMEIEHRRVRSATPAPKPQLQPQSQQPQPQQSLVDFLVRKLTETGPMSSENLCRLAVQEGYFAEGDSIEQAVQATLTQVVKTGQIQQLPNASFGPTVVTDMTRLRRAI
jgi:hypothetical protein